MLKYIVYFLLATGLMTGLVFAYGSFVNEERAAEEISLLEEAAAGTEEVIKVVPQDFPVNKLPDNWFGKPVEELSIKQIKPGGEPLSESAGDFPDWLDQVISRESIVAFNQVVLAKAPEDQQFSQVFERNYTGAGGWSAYLVGFETSPSKHLIAIMGAYQSEDDSYWMSYAFPERVDLSLETIAALDEGVKLWGKDGAAAFQVELKKESATRVTDR